MTVIKNIEILTNILSQTEFDNLDAAAEVHFKQSTIEFTIISLQDNILTVETEQGKTSGNYANFKTLIKRTGEVFNKYLSGGITLQVNAKEFAESPATTVNYAWINKKMLEKEVRIKQIAFDTGIDRKDISGWVTGERSMSQLVKAMFYYYFASI